MGNPCLTPAEWERVRAYDAMTRKRMDADRPTASPDTIKELRAAMEANDLDTLRELQSDIAVLIRVREHWPNIPEIRDMANYLIRMERYEIEDLHEEIRNAKR